MVLSRNVPKVGRLPISMEGQGMEVANRVLELEHQQAMRQPSQYGAFLSREELAKLNGTIYKPLCPKTGNKPKYHER